MEQQEVVPAFAFAFACAPAVVLAVWIAGGAVVFAARGGCARFPDDESARRVTGLTSRSMRIFFAWLMAPWVRLLLRAHVRADTITFASLVLALAAAAALAHDRFVLGGTLYCAAGACDFFDGRVARARSGATPAGAALDSILDRYTEAAVLVGLAWFYRASWVLVAVLLALVGSMLVPYVRARGESLQAASTLSSVGWMQRPERVVVIATTAALAPAFDLLFPASQVGMHWLAVAGVVVVAVGTQLTALQRTAHLVRALAPAGARSPLAPTTRGPVRAPASRSASWLRGH